jgi:hypothetical protein
MADLRRFLDQAHDTHPHEPRAIADQLLARAAALPADETGAEAVRLAEHVMLGHLADTGTLQRFLQALPRPSAAADPTPHAAWSEARARVQWALHMLADEGAATARDDGHGAASLAAAPRWRALQNVVLALAGTGRVSEASAHLSCEAEAATAHADPEARRAYAICTNNVALELREGPRGDPARDALMLEAAVLARRAWTAAGTWLHVERADYQLARCHAVIGRGTEALACARACLDACMANGAEADERFFAHEALWHAQRAAGDDAGAAIERKRMHALLEQIADAETHAWCAATLAGIEDAPGSLR